MMNSKFSKVTIIAGLALSMTAVTGCFKRTGVTAQTSSSSVSQGVTASGDYPVVSGLSTTQVLNFRSVLPTYSTLLNVTPSSAALTIAKNDAPTYSLDSSPTSVTAPMLFSQAKLSAEMCLVLVNKEKALAASSRMFFNATDFTKAPSGQSSNWITDAAQRLSLRLCGHDVSATLAAQISSDITSALGTTTQDSADAALMTCTGYLASACTLTNN